MSSNPGDVVAATAPPTLGGYGQEHYWNARYRNQKQHYDWYVTWDQFKELILPKLPTGVTVDNLKVLTVGCGNSDLGEHMFDDGFTNQISIDISEVVIQQMTEEVTSQLQQVRFVQMDVREMKFEDDHFDLIIDKGYVCIYLQLLYH